MGTNSNDLRIEQLEGEIDRLESLLSSKDEEMQELRLRYHSLESDFNFKVFQDAFRFNINLRDRQRELGLKIEQLEDMYKDLRQDIAISEMKIFQFLENIIGREEEDPDVVEERVLQFIDQVKRG